MEIVILQIETYLFETEEGQFRAMTFYELSIDERIVYENKVPKYLIDFNRTRSFDTEYLIVVNQFTKYTRFYIAKKINFLSGSFEPYLYDMFFYGGQKLLKKNCRQIGFVN